MLNFQFTQNIIASFAPQVTHQAATDVVAALADSFTADSQKNHEPSDFNETLASVDAKSQSPSKKNSANDTNSDKAISAQNAPPQKPDKNTSLTAEDEAVQEKPPLEDESEAEVAGRGKEISANDNVQAGDGKLDAKKILQDVQDVIDQIDLALASGADQLSAEMAALLNAMKLLLQQILQQFNAALQLGTVEGTETVLLDSNTFNPLLKQLNALVDSLKKANAALAAQLGLSFSDDEGDEAADALNATQAGNDLPQGSAGAKPIVAVFASLQNIELRATHVQVKLENAIGQSANPLPAFEHANAFAASDALANVLQPLSSNEQAASAEEIISRALDIKTDADAAPTIIPHPLIQSTPASTSVNVTVAAALHTVTAAGGQFGNSNQGQSQGNLSQPNVPQSATGASVAPKDGPNFDQLLKQPHQVRGSASEQVIFQMKSMMKDGTTKMIVKLDPPELGELEIRMQVSRQGRADVIISVERVQTLELLQKDSKLLQQALNDAGLNSGESSLNFNLRGENNSGGRQQGNNPYPVQVEENFDDDLLQVASATYSTDIQYGVNIRI